MKTQQIEYTFDGARMVGHLAYNDQVSGPRAGILVLPEWWGLNAHARERAERLAKMGYAALAVDLYGDGRVADTPDQAAALYGEVMGDIPGVAKGRILAARAALLSVADPDRIGVIGFCFGGTLALHMARLGTPFRAFVSFHGNYDTEAPAEAGRALGPVLVCDGADDQLRDEASIPVLKTEFERAQVPLTFRSYIGAQHAFTNPAADEKAKKYGLPLAYNEAADTASWTDMTTFLAEALGPR